MANPFAGVSKAEPSESGKYFPYARARYTATISRVTMVDSRKYGDLFTVEFQIDESNHDDVGGGEIRTWQMKMSNIDTTPGNLQLFALAAMGVKSSDPEGRAKALSKVEQGLQDAIEKGVWNGRRVLVTTEPIRTKAGKDFTKCTFSPAG